MNNGDMPANSHSQWDNDFDKVVQQWSGLSKREYFAAMAMQGLLASIGSHDVTDSDEIAHDAKVYADKLLSELEK